MRHQFEAGELAQHDGFLLGQHAAVQQVGEHALQAVGVFAHVFQKQYAALDLWEIRRAQKRHQHRQIATPELGVVDFHGALSLSLGQAPARALALLQEQVFKTGLHDVVRPVEGAKVLDQRRALPSNGARLGQHRQTQGSEVTQTHKLRARLHRLGNGAIGQRVQKPRQTIAPARDHGHIRTAGRRPANSR